MASKGLAAIAAPGDARDYLVLEDVVDEEPLPAAEAWEEFRSVVWAHALAPARSDVQEALAELEDAIENGRRPTAGQVRAAREALDRAQALVEDHYAPLADGVRSWGDGAGKQIPYGVMAEQLERAGYRVERPGTASDSIAGP